MAEVLAEIISPNQKKYLLKINGKEYLLQKITMRKLLKYQALADKMTKPTLEGLDDLVKFLVSEILIGAKVSDFEDVDTGWFIMISNAMASALQAVTGEDTADKARAVDPKEVTTPKQSQGSQGSTDTK